MPEALVGLGGNLGDVPTTLGSAIQAFCDGKTVRLLARSANYRTPPWGLEEQPPFINACIAVDTDLSPRALLGRAMEVEKAFGRDRKAAIRWGPRTLDIDLLTYGDVELDEPGLTLPHPRMGERAFVLVPLLEIRPDTVVAGRRLSDALAGLDRTEIERLADGPG
jgi:2-amino-4-hydroxy-6-hydroxymethyldihydropteridine diphosphokinase